jgi:hypothetical protein
MPSEEPDWAEIPEWNGSEGPDLGTSASETERSYKRFRIASRGQGVFSELATDGEYDGYDSASGDSDSEISLRSRSGTDVEACTIPQMDIESRQIPAMSLLETGSNIPVASSRRTSKRLAATRTSTPSSGTGISNQPIYESAATTASTADKYSADSVAEYKPDVGSPVVRDYPDPSKLRRKRPERPSRQTQRAQETKTSTREGATTRLVSGEAMAKGSSTSLKSDPTLEQRVGTSSGTPEITRTSRHTGSLSVSVINGPQNMKMAKTATKCGSGTGKPKKPRIPRRPLLIHAVEGEVPSLSWIKIGEEPVVGVLSRAKDFYTQALQARPPTMSDDSEERMDSVLKQTESLLMHLAFLTERASGERFQHSVAHSANQFGNLKQGLGGFIFHCFSDAKGVSPNLDVEYSLGRIKKYETTWQAIPVVPEVKGAAISGAQSSSSVTLP